MAPRVLWLKFIGRGDPVISPFVTARWVHSSTTIPLVHCSSCLFSSKVHTVTVCPPCPWPAVWPCCPWLLSHSSLLHCFYAALLHPDLRGVLRILNAVCHNCGNYPYPYPHPYSTFTGDLLGLNSVTLIVLFDFCFVFNYSDPILFALLALLVFQQKRALQSTHRAYGRFRAVFVIVCNAVMNEVDVLVMMGIISSLRVIVGFDGEQYRALSRSLLA